MTCFNLFHFLTSVTGENGTNPVIFSCQSIVMHLAVFRCNGIYI